MRTSLLVPLLLIAGAYRRGVGRWIAARAIPPDVARALVAGSTLALVDSVLFREPGYFAIVTPLTAALSTWCFVREQRPSGGAPAWHGAAWRVWQACGLALLASVTFAAVAWTRDLPMLQPATLGENLSDTVDQFLASPPADHDTPALQYLRDCTREGDRLLVTGSTPFHVNYYGHRGIAGGHVLWRHGWRSDPEHESESLAMLERQSVPFAYSNRDAVLDNLTAYPRIRAHVARHYGPVAGSGQLLIDRRRTPTGFGPGGLPCFQRQ